MRSKYRPPVYTDLWAREQLAVQAWDATPEALRAEQAGGVTATLTARERKVARFFKQEGFERPYLMVAAAKRANVTFETAAAHIAMETGNGRMIFGCDFGPGVAFCHEKVTKAKVAALLASPRSNGVGSLQLTFKPFVREADSIGGAHRYYPCTLTGFRILRRNFDANGKNLRTAFRQYNGTGPAAERYADMAMAKRREYQEKLARFLNDHVSPTEKRIRQVQADLLTLGFGQVGKVDGEAGPATRGAVEQFKRMCVRHRFKRIDGSIGPKTAEIIHEHCVKYHGKVSKHFSFREFASTTRGSCRGNGHIKGHRDLITGLEKLRARAGGPLAVVNGHRDPSKNACVGGKSKSQHLFGNAADCAPGLNVDQVRALGVFSGIGFSQSTGRVLHVDVRHADRAHNFTGGTTARPTTWVYA